MRNQSRLVVTSESWALAQPFVISRGTKTSADVIVATVSQGALIGRGEAVPYARYGETLEDTLATLTALGDAVPTRAELQSQLPAGAARNALDCALWDLEAKQKAIPAFSLSGLASSPTSTLQPRQTAYTLSLGSPDNMAQAASNAQHQKCLKLKLGGGAEDAERMRAVRHARPDAELMADANEGWHDDQLEHLLEVAAAAKFSLIEQPLPADADEKLANIAHPIPICADESLHTSSDLANLKGRYDAVNIKLDKAGGLTEAIKLLQAAQSRGFDVMVGCMVATSLAMAPAFLLAQHAKWVDLDGPLLLAKDRPHGLDIRDGKISPPTPDLWG